MVDWNKISIGDIISEPPTYGINAPACEYQLGLPRYIRITDITTDGRFSQENIVYVNHKLSSNYFLSDGDIILARTGASTGKSYLYHLTDGRLVFAGFLIRLKIDKTKADSRFVYSAVNTEKYWNWVKKVSSRSGQPGINSIQYASYTFLLPSLPEQRRIAEVLTDVDSLIESLEKLIDKKKAIKQGAMQELLTGKKRLPGFTGEWVEKKFGDICPEILKGQSLSSGKFVMGSIPVIAGGKIPAGYHNRANRSGKTITISASGASAGYVAIHNYPIFATDCSTIGENTFYDIDYLYYLLLSNQEEIYKRQTGGAQPHIHSKDIKPLFCKVPQTKDEQTAIATVLSDMDSEIAELEQKLSKYCNIKTGMMQTLLTGKIRLPEEKVIENAAVAQQEGDMTVPNKKRHNRQFDDAVAIAAIVNAFYSEKYPLGRKKVQKLLYLMRRKQEVDTTEFKKKAAGPYAEGIRYKGGEKILKNNGYANIVESPDGAIFSKGKNIGVALKYVSEWNWQSVIDWLFAKFRYVGKDKLEVLATIDMAICDLIHSGETPSFETVKHLIASNKEWKEKLNKAYFSDEDIKQAIDECYQLFNYSRG